jgi:nucleoside-diphosphate-sugar epimerase
MSVIEDDVLSIIRELESSFEKLKKRNILITGATGHLGQYFLKLFLMADKLLGLDLNLFSTSKSVLDKSFIKYRMDFKNLQGDLTDLNFVASFPNFDYIFHLAGDAQPTKFINNSSSTISINTLVVDMLLNKLNQDGNFLFISSSEVYNLDQLITEEKNESMISVNHPRAGYIFSKIFGEIICRSSQKNAKVIRLSMTYGPGIKKNDSRAFSSFLREGMVDQLIRLKDDGKAIREYLYVADGVRAILRALLEGKSNFYNIGSGVRGKITIKEIAEIISKLLSVDLQTSKSEVPFLSAFQSVTLDVTKYESEFGEILRVPIKEGIERTIKWAEQEHIFGD